MIHLNEWAIRWNINPEAIEDLRRIMGSINTDLIAPGGDSEAAIQTLIRLEASRKGLRLWRNNVGATTTDDGGFVRYGLCNESKAMNETIKSSDLIGIRPVRIEQHHVGQILGQFVAREVKRAGWRYRGDKRELAQLRFLELVLSLGGDAGFANSEGSI